MKSLFTYIAFIFLFVILFSVVGRIVFVLYGWGLFDSVTNSDIITAFWYGLKHDISLASYCVMLVCALSPLLFVGVKWYRYTAATVLSIFIAIFSLVTIANLEIYNSWMSHIDVSIFQFFDKTFSFLASTNSIDILLFIIGWVVFSGLGVFVYLRYIHTKLQTITKVRWYIIVLNLVCGALFFIPARGSLDVAGMNTGAVYFSNTLQANHIAVNVVWNFLSSATQSSHNQTENMFMSSEKAHEIYHDITNEQGATSEYVISKTTQNIIFIMLEGVGSDITSTLGTYTGITPQFDSLCNEGILFTNVYAAGTRTDKGVTAMLSGYPAQSQKPIMGFSNKVEKLPTISKILFERGYNTMFLYGGNKQFCNMNTLITTGAFKQVYDIQNFDNSLRTFKWGVHDEFVFQKSFETIQLSSEPFFAFIMTLSHHEPFTVPTNGKFNEHGELAPIFTAAHYADSCLGNFIGQAKQQAWWNNTLIVLIADHANTKPGKKTHADIERYHIPMLWIGGAIKKPMVVNKTCSQIDVPATVLNQLNISSADFEFSKNIFDSTYSGYALFAHHDGFGLATQSYYQIWDSKLKKYIAHTNTAGNDSLFCKAYWQITIEDFLSK